MSQSSDDESSDSSDDFLVSADKIDLNSSFFSEKTGNVKTNLKTKRNVTVEESDDDDDFDNVSDQISDKNSSDIFSQVLKDLESTNVKHSRDDSTEDSGIDGTFTKKPKEEDCAADGQDNFLSNEIKDLLLQGESGNYHKKEESSSDDEQNAEEVSRPSEYTIPKEGVKITLPGANLMIGRKKRGRTDLQTVLKNRINQRLKTSQILIHKVGLLCWLGHGFYLNKQINDSEVMSVTLSLVPMSNYPKGRVDLTYLEKFTKWFKKMFTIKEKSKEECITKDTLLIRLKNKNVFNYKELVLLYIATLRAIGLNCRLVISLCPPRLKVPSEQLFKTKADIEKEKERQKEKEKVNGPTKSKSKNNQEKQSSEKKKNASNSKKVKKEEVQEETVIPKNSDLGRRNANLEARKKAAAILQAKSAKTGGKKGEAQNSTKKAETDSKDEVISKRTRAQTHMLDESNSKSSKTDLNESMSLSRKLRSRIIKEDNIKKKDDKKNVPKMKEGKKVDPKPSTSNEVIMDEDYEPDEQFDSDEDFVVKHPLKRKINTSKDNAQSKPRSKGQKYRKLLSSDDESDDAEKFKKSEYMWAEVYVESEESWISVSIMDEKIHCVNELYKKATTPVLYIIAWNAGGSLKDVTRRYCPQWLTVTRKKRVDEKWWRESLAAWKEKDTAISKAEDEMLLQKELEQPLPKTIGECKGHPLYVLVRHLLKYEGLYPPDVVPLGHLPNGEAIYSRHCVYTLCSRETWIKQARVVKPAQEPYKIVKAMPKYDKLSGMKLKDQPLELFGIWQTTEYVPPEAKDGIVPRNEYGNVDLFKQCMLPKGTVHINLPGLNRVARKLNIDCAPAVVGFNFGCMGAVPAFEGFVVCSEYEDTMREAWEAEQVEIARRAREKREQRIYGNWKKLIKGLIIRERLAAKYGFRVKEDEAEASTSTKRTKHKTTNVKKAKAS